VQRFFLSFSNNWCTQLRPEVMRTVILTNPHSMPKYRVNNTVANMPEFAKAFGCAKGKPLVHETRVVSGSVRQLFSPVGASSRF